MQCLMRFCGRRVNPVSEVLKRILCRDKRLTPLRGLLEGVSARRFWGSGVISGRKLFGVSVKTLRRFSQNS